MHVEGEGSRYLSGENKWFQQELVQVLPNEIKRLLKAVSESCLFPLNVARL